MKPKLGILHPGNMGISIAASAQNSGCQVMWASEGRSALTRERAERFGLQDSGSLDQLCRTSAIVVSVCPPHAAEEVADQVVARSYSGLYLDANAISPQAAKRIDVKLEAAGVAMVDGGIIGGPAWEPGQTWLYLSGERALELADCFAAGPLETTIIGSEIGKASALKVCYAAWTKGSTALLCAIVAAAAELDVWPELQRQWDRDWPGFDQQAIQRLQRVTAKAWRFEGEMTEIAATFAAAGLPGGFHTTAAEIYQRLSHFKDLAETPGLEDVLAALVKERKRSR